VQRIGLSVDDHLLFTADQSKPQLAVIDTATNKLKTWISLPALGYGATPTPDGRWLIVPLRSGDQVAVVDLDAMKVARTVTVRRCLKRSSCVRMGPSLMCPAMPVVRSPRFALLIGPSKR